MDPGSETALGVLLGGGAMRHRTTGEMVFHLGVLDLDATGSEAAALPASIDLGFLAHGITKSPHDPARYVLFEKHGPGCCVVDLRELAVVHTIAAGTRRQFYGHGVFTADGSLLLCTETDVEDRLRGYIAVRDAHDFTLLGDFPSYGLAPHDCMLTDAGRTLVIANGGSAVGEPDPPNVAWVDVATQALAQRHDIPDPVLNAGHLAMTDAGDLAVVSAPRDGLDPTKCRGGISLLPHGRTFTTLADPPAIRDGMIGETLSVAIHAPTRTVGATSPLGNLVAFFDLETGAVRKTLRVPNPRGITLTLRGDEFIVNFGDPPRAARVDATTLLPVDAVGNRVGYPSLATGSHIVVTPAA